MHYKISRENYFAEFMYKINGEGRWKLSDSRRLKRIIKVKA